MGVRYDIENQHFVFDFKHDGTEDIISLTGKGYEVTAFGKCFHYGYEFGDDVEGSVRSAFIKHLKFPKRPLKEDPDLTQFIQRAIDGLHKKINLYNYEIVVSINSSRRVNRYMRLYTYRFAQPRIMNSENLTCEQIQDKDVEKINASNALVIDDIATSGSTLNEVMRSLSVLNENNNITIFSLIGRKDLMAETA